jgi:hypothetical protein
MKRPYVGNLCKLIVLLSAAVLIGNEPLWGRDGALGQDQVSSYGTEERDCLAWNDGCQICVRKPNQSASCSNVGIACLQRKVNCDERMPPAGK